MRILIIAQFLLLFALPIQAVLAEKTLGRDDAKAVNERVKATGSRVETTRGLSDFEGINLNCSNISDNVLMKNCRTAQIARYEYYVFGLNNRRNVLQWQNISSYVIFVIVLTLVTVGVYFAWKQFSISLEEKGSESISTVEIGATGLKVSSPVLGVVILVISLGFFYLYLVHVYPVIEIK